MAKENLNEKGKLYRAVCTECGPVSEWTDEKTAEKNREEFLKIEGNEHNTVDIVMRKYPNLEGIPHMAVCEDCHKPVGKWTTYERAERDVEIHRQNPRFRYHEVNIVEPVKR